MSVPKDSAATGTVRGLHVAVSVAAGQDRYGEHHALGFNTIDSKLTPQDSAGLLIIEVTRHAKGGPERHVHLAQDEWFYILEGQFVIEVGAERFRPAPGEALLAPRRVPHVWAHVGDGTGRFLAVLNPAGKMEAFFRDMGRIKSIAPPDPALWRVYDLEWAGPPLPIDL